MTPAKKCTGQTVKIRVITFSSYSLITLKKIFTEVHIANAQWPSHMVVIISRQVSAFLIPIINHLLI